MADRIWLIGMMGSGKTAAGADAAARLGVEFVDTDAIVADRVGFTIADYWSREGESAFREHEREAVEEAADGPAAVIATGGGVVLDRENVATMKASGRVIWLSAAPQVLAERVGTGDDRPLLDGAITERLQEILEERHAAYEEAADDEIATDDMSHDEVVQRLVEVWEAS